MRYGNYEAKNKCKEQYLVLNPNDIINIKDLYDMFSKMDSILVDLLNIGRMCLEEDVIKYYFSGVPYKINMYGKTPEISWQPNSLKQAIDLSFGFMLCSEKNPLKICKHCSKVFYTKNPKAEYCCPQCRNQANVYKSREKNK